ncbi:hypothetical protein ABEF93_005153 [Exophiala dermatitidis]
MYRHSAQVNCIPRNAPPSPDTTSDSESDILDALQRKRRQLDEEIARFKAAKDREFREFEKELRLHRKKARSLESCCSSNISSSSSASAGILTAHGPVGHHKSKRAEVGVGAKIVKTTPLSPATLSLAKLNITGETLPLNNDLVTPSVLTKTNSRSTPPGSLNTTPPRSQKDSVPNPQHPPQPPTPTSDRTDSFAGVFTPSYLPLLDSRDRTPPRSSPQPLTPQEEEKKQLQHPQQPDAADSTSNQKAERDRQRPPLKSSQSLPEQPVSPPVVVTSTKRAKSTGQIPTSASSTNNTSTSLPPSALRKTSKSGVRKDAKHVHFQLADSTVVDPSSSYEESSPGGMSSPEKEDSEDSPSSSFGTSTGSGGTLKKTKSRKGSPKHLKLPSTNDGGGIAGRRGRFLSPIPSPLPSPSPSPSPTIHGTGMELDSESPFSGGLVMADDGGSGVGFFELDEELASPGLRDRPFEEEAEIEEVEDIDVDAEASTTEDMWRDDDGKRIPFGRDEGDEGFGAAATGLGSSFAAGSVPIDIVRPTGSWVGSFGH